ncbi:Alpha/Beta hydrolase protein [Xylariales sp. AK1849]|nr:Alpha/Beta hydrolase protein [Xylariales sp. AK1849]
MTELKYDPEFWEIFKAFVGLESPTFDDPVAFRNYHEKPLGERFKKVPRQGDITETKHEVTSADGTKIIVHRFMPRAVRDATTPQRAIVYIHGGGMICGSVELFRPLIEGFAARCEVQLFAVEYRLAPEHPAPAGVEDTYAALKWLQANSNELNIDPARVGLMGSSAGGGIATGAALMARDNGLRHPLARLVLLYPMLDDRTTLNPEDPFNKVLTWNVQTNDMGWKAYLGGRDRDQRGDDVSIYAAPSRAESLHGLPPTYIDVGGFDLFVDEDIAFAGKLAKANNSVELHVYPGLIHGWEGVAPLIRASKEAAANRKRVLTDF